MAQVIAELQELWTEHRPEIDINVALVEEAVGALASGELDDAGRDSAKRAAHQLAGTVGTFGFTDASEQAHALEQALEQAPAREDAPRLAELVAALRAGLEDDVEPLDARRVLGARPPPEMPVTTLRDARPRTRPSILAIDDDPAILAAVRALLGERDWTVSTHGDPAAIWDALERHCPDLLLLDIDMPGTTGVELCQAVRADPRWSALPVVFLTARRDPETISAVFDAGADDLLNKPIVAAELVARLANRLERTLEAEGEAGAVAVDVVVVEDDVVLSDLLQDSLRARGYSCCAIADGDEAMSALTGTGAKVSAPLVLLDWDLPNRSGLDVLRGLGQAGVLAETRVLMLTLRSSEDETREALELGAFDHLAKPFSVPVLMERVRRALMRTTDRSQR